MVGQRLVEALRERDTAGSWAVTVLAEERRPAYDRIRLSAFFDGVPEQELTFATPDGVDLRLGEPALAVDRTGCVVSTRDGGYGYDALVLATGSYPFVPPIDGAQRPGCFTYRTLDDLVAIREYAIGECAEIGGRCYGLVVPGYAMAEVVADRLLGGTARFPGADTSTKLKLLGVDVASFGSALETGALDVVYADPANQVYAKLVLSDDARTLLGGVLVGDASAYPTLRASLGGPLPAPPLALLAPAEDRPALPATAEVCTCNAVTKDRIVAAIQTQGCSDVAALKACTRAGTSCGSCVPLLKRLLTEAGVAQSKALCEHFAYSRAELFDIVRVRGITTFSHLVTEYGTGRGCDICKPAVASILASLGNGYVLDGEQATLQDTNDHFLANLQRNGTYSVVPRIPGGEITPDKLIVIGEVARDFNLYTKITGGQRIDLFGARLEQLPAIW